MGTTHGADGRGGVIEAGGYRQRETGWERVASKGGHIRGELLADGAQQSYLLGRHWEGGDVDGDAWR